MTSSNVIFFLEVKNEHLQELKINKFIKQRVKSNRKRFN